MSRLVVGRHSVFETLRVRPKYVTKLFVSPSLETKKWAEDLKKLCKINQIKLTPKNESFFNKLCQNHQGLCCEVSQNPSWPETQNQNSSLLLALDGVEDPHNLGAIVRTSWLMGVCGILLSSRGVSFESPTVSKVASGGLEHVPIMGVKNLKQEIKELKAQGFWSYALCAPEASEFSKASEFLEAQKPSSESLASVKTSEKTVLIAGAEEKGIKQSLIKSSDFRVFIPQKESSSRASYNVSVAVALGLWSLKQREREGGGIFG